MNNLQNVPPGLKKLLELCFSIYPDQPNPTQVTAVVKYWLGGQEPLDYISIYSNPGDKLLKIPPHWHYITFGLSDLHGDGRIHPPERTHEFEELSGMGFELTFRLLKEDSNSSNAVSETPPTWPTLLLQALAKYVFESGNRLCIGDNVPWKKALDNSDSKIQHMLVSEDPQLHRIETAHGYVEFCQIVGVTSEELEEASRWNCKGILNLLKSDPRTGGLYLVTNMNRSQSVFEISPESLKKFEANLEREGSDLAGVNAEFIYTEYKKPKEIKKEKIDGEIVVKDEPSIIDFDEIIKIEENDEFPNLLSMEISPYSSQTKSSLSMSWEASNSMALRFIHFDGVELTLAPYAAKFLKLAIKDRIRHGRHFTFKNQENAVTFVAETVTGSFVSKKYRFGVSGYWLQILITNKQIPQILASLQPYEKIMDNLPLPTVFEWCNKNLRIIIDDPKPKLILPSSSISTFPETKVFKQEKP